VVILRTVGIVFIPLVIFNLSFHSSPFLVALLVLLVTGHSDSALINQEKPGVVDSAASPLLAMLGTLILPTHLA
jgi:hypothetical protein